VLKKIHQREDEIDKREVKLSDKIVNTIVLYQPVASELRRIIACYRILISMERIGDMVVNITNFIKKIKTPEVYEKLKEVLSSMTIQSIKMVRKSLLAYLNDDKEFAIWTIKNDVVFDEINHKLLKKIISKTDTAESNKHLLMSIITIKEMMSNIERIADHATNIAEAAIYSIEGKDIRHHKIEG
jgi:phosphate transport system protein